MIMKFLILLSYLLSFDAFSEVDLPSSVSGNNEVLDYIWNKNENNELDVIEYQLLRKQIITDQLTLINKTILNNLDSQFFSKKDIFKIFISKLSPREAVEFYSKKDSFNNNSYELSALAKRSLDKAEKIIRSAQEFTPMTKNQIMNLVFKTPDLSSYSNGEYKDTVRLFLFCREDRNYPCLFLMKDIFGNLVREKQVLWSLPALAKSARNIPFYKTNGETPTGVHTMNSVMLEANRQDAFGKFRRVILNWIPENSDEVSTHHFLPKMHHKLKWWKRASISRDAGRKYLRIHGTGRFNDEPDLSYYPHIATSGCISTKEGRYFGIDFKHQRLVLDQLMKSSRLAPVYSNETNIKGILYVVNLDDKKQSVLLKDLNDYGIN